MHGAHRLRPLTSPSLPLAGGEADVPGGRDTGCPRGRRNLQVCSSGSSQAGAAPPHHWGHYKVRHAPLNPAFHACKLHGHAKIPRRPGRLPLCCFSQTPCNVPPHGAVIVSTGGKEHGPPHPALNLIPLASSSPPQTTRIALERGLIQCQGKTPEATMASALYTDVRRKLDKSCFTR
jgi:hypothetical protein